MIIAHIFEIIGELAQCAGLLLLQWQIHRITQYLRAQASR